jgi:hypothetical protein
MAHIIQVADMVYAHRRTVPESEIGTTGQLLNRVISGEGRRSVGWTPTDEVSAKNAARRENRVQLPGDTSVEADAAADAAQTKCC